MRKHTIDLLGKGSEGAIFLHGWAAVDQVSDSTHMVHRVFGPSITSHQGYIMSNTKTMITPITMSVTRA